MNRDSRVVPPDSEIPKAGSTTPSDSSSDLIARSEAETRQSVRPVRTSVLRRTFISLEVPEFRRLWLAILLMMAIGQMMGIAQSFLAYQLTGSAKVLALVQTGGAMSMLVLAPVGGVIADRVERKRILQAAQLLFVSLSLAVGASIIFNLISWQLLVAAGAAQGAIWSFAAPARQALVSSMVPKEKMGNAIALAGLGASASSLAAPVGGGIIYAVAGPEAVYVTVAFMALVAFAFTTSLPRVYSSLVGPSRRLVADVRGGLNYILGNRVLRVLLLSHIVITLLSSPLQMLMPALVVDVYHRQSGSFGLMLGVSGAGSMVGALFIASIGNQRRGLMFIGAAFATATVLLVVASSHSFVISTAFMLVLGVGNVGMWSLSQALGMENADEEYRGRVMSVFMMSFGLSAIAALPVGLAADAYGTQTTLTVLGAVLLATAAFLLATQKSLRQLM
ncbi:MAG: MFS transporter [Chloroflexi bacterium]|nr:MFS transporter [Chloroflexota bacterium]